MGSSVDLGAFTVLELQEKAAWVELGRGRVQGTELRIAEDCIDVRTFQTVQAISGDLVLATRRAPLKTLGFLTEIGAVEFEKHLSELRKVADPMGQCSQQSVASYFDCYGKLNQQQNMLQDYVRTSTYYRAVKENATDFSGKTVMDIGAGSGILSFFAAQHGAAKVWAVEASRMAEVITLLAQAPANVAFGKVVEVVPQVLETILDDRIARGSVDILISEPIGTLLFNERMIESYLRARDRFLKPGGRMYPRGATLFVAPFSDQVLWQERLVSEGVNFWRQTFFGVHLSAALPLAHADISKQPVIDYINPAHLVALACATQFDFMTVDVSSLEHLNIPFEFEATCSADIHGLATWFDIDLGGSEASVILSTAPSEPGTHWYQVRLLLQTPLQVQQGDIIRGELDMLANTRQSYDCKVKMYMGSQIVESVLLDLKEPEYRFFASPNCYQPVLLHGSSPDKSTLTPAGSRQGFQQNMNSMNDMLAQTINGGWSTMNGHWNPYEASYWPMYMTPNPYLSTPWQASEPNQTRQNESRGGGMQRRRKGPRS